MVGGQVWKHSLHTLFLNLFYHQEEELSLLWEACAYTGAWPVYVE